MIGIIEISQIDHKISAKVQVAEASGFYEDTMAGLVNDFWKLMERFIEK